jgi:hypothetical protein
MRKLPKRLLIGGSLTAILGVAFYAWAANPTLGDLRVHTFSAARVTTDVDTYTIVVKNGGSDSAYNVRLAFRIPQDLASQNTTLPSAAQSSATGSDGTEGAACNGTATLPYGGLRVVVCTATRIDPATTWTVTIPINNSAEASLLASAQVFADTPDGATVGSSAMSDNFKAIVFSP